MARRGTSAVAEQPEVEETTEGITEPTTEAPTETKAEEVEIDLTAFNEAVEAASQEADTSTGEVPPVAIEQVNKAYRELPGLKAKNKARASLEASMMKAVENKDLTGARVFVDLKNGLSAGGGGSSTPKAPADPTQAFVQKVVALRLASQLTEGNVPEGVSEDWSTKADELHNSLDEDVEKLSGWDGEGDAPEVSPVVRQAFKLAAGKASGGGRVPGGPRRDVEKHIQQVFADLPVGTFMTMTEISKARSTEYGDDRPSSGAVSSRLLPKGKEPYDNGGIRGTGGNGKARGAEKYADA
jgi:hypothetical protein